MGAELPLPIPFKVFYFMLPYMFVDEETNLIRGTQVSYWLNKTQILKVIESCNKTLQYYDEMQYSDEVIECKNDLIFREEYNIGKHEYPKKIMTYVYIMIDHNTKYYKIGRSDNPLKREKTLQSEKPTIELIHKFKCEYGIEKELHNLYKHKRIRGEWFKLDNDDIWYIKTYYK